MSIEVRIARVASDHPLLIAKLPMSP